MRDRTLRLYKYISLAGDYGREAVKRAILQNQLYWQSPNSFNDPFDCLPVLHFGDDNRDRRQFYSRAAKLVCGGPRPQRRNQQRKMSAIPARQMEKILRARLLQSLKESAVTCFSEVPDHPLMWGHYADSHRGICMIFDEVANEQIQWFGFPVEYTENRPRVNLTKFNDPDVMKSALFQKSVHWQYEREHRMIEWQGAAGYREFPSQSFSGIIFGAKIATDDKVFVRDLLLQRPGLNVYQASVDELEFKLNIVLEV
jgi:Protein of unknown function (DUF2971)